MRRAHPYAADAASRSSDLGTPGPAQGRAKRWLRYEDDLVARSPIVYFEYPSAEAGGLDYVHHRPEDQPTPVRYARHYADMARLLQHANASTMLGDHTLCARVVEWKGRVFARQWARYDLAKPGSFRLLPSPARHVALARDYAQMRAMFLAPPPDFSAVLGTLEEAERKLNAG